MAANLNDQASGLSQITGVSDYASTGASGTSGQGVASPDSSQLQPTGTGFGDTNALTTGAPNSLPPVHEAGGVSESAATGSVGYFPGTGPREDGSDLYRPSSFGATAPSTTGAGNSAPNHDHNGVN